VLIKARKKGPVKSSLELFQPVMQMKGANRITVSLFNPTAEIGWISPYSDARFMMKEANRRSLF
jgi:hypothetical protein